MSLAAITTLRRQLHEWTARPANAKFLQADQELALRAALDDPARATQRNVAAWMLGTWHCGRGMFRVLEGEAEGFDEARFGQALRRCSLLLRERHQGPMQRRTGGKGLPFSRLHGAWTALLGLTLQDPGAEPLYELLRHEPESTFTETDALPLFVHELLTLRAGERPTVTPRLGPYQDVLVHWDAGGRLLAQALTELLNIHLEGTRGAGAPFDDPPCRLYPIEVLAVRQVREWLDLPMPKVDHPLMHTNLATMAPVHAWPQHELVARLERQLQRR